MAMTAAYIEEIARAVVGDHTGWQARFADTAGISRAHLSNVLKGTRPVTDDFKKRVLAACVEQSGELAERAERLDGYANEIRLSMMSTPPAGYTREQYEADADEAEAMIGDMIKTEEGGA